MVNFLCFPCWFVSKRPFFTMTHKGQGRKEQQRNSKLISPRFSGGMTLSQFLLRHPINLSQWSSISSAPPVRSQQKRPSATAANQSTPPQALYHQSLHQKPTFANALKMAIFLTTATSVSNRMHQLKESKPHGAEQSYVSTRTRSAIRHRRKMPLQRWSW